MTIQLVFNNADFTNHCMQVPTKIRITSGLLTQGLLGQNGGIRSDNETLMKRVCCLQLHSFANYPILQIPPTLKWTVGWYDENGVDQATDYPHPWTTTSGIVNLDEAVSIPKSSCPDATHYMLSFGDVNNNTITPQMFDTIYKVYLMPPILDKILSTDDMVQGLVQANGQINNALTIKRLTAKGYYWLQQYSKIKVPTTLKWCVTWFDAYGNACHSANPNAWTDGTGEFVDITSAVKNEYANCDLNRTPVSYRLSVGLTSNENMDVVDIANYAVVLRHK